MTAIQSPRKATYIWHGNTLKVLLITTILSTCFVSPHLFSKQFLTLSRIILSSPTISTTQAPFKFTLYTITDSARVRLKEVRKNGRGYSLVDCNFSLPTRVLDIKAGSETLKMW